MKVELDKFELVYFLEGCASGSHLRQGVWRRVVEDFVPKMSVEQMNFTWWVCFRDMWDNYFTSFTGDAANCGAEDFLHALSVLNINNRYMVDTDYEGKRESYFCYRFRGEYYPMENGRFNRHIAKEHITNVERMYINSEDMEDRMLNAWRDVSIYDKEVIELVNTRTRDYKFIKPDEQKGVL